MSNNANATSNVYISGFTRVSIVPTGLRKRNPPCHIHDYRSYIQCPFVAHQSDETSITSIIDSLARHHTLRPLALQLEPVTHGLHVVSPRKAVKSILGVESRLWSKTELELLILMQVSSKVSLIATALQGLICKMSLVRDLNSPVFVLGLNTYSLTASNGTGTCSVVH